MKVILLSDIKKLGKKGEIKEVSDGYAQNFLIARNLALPASKGNISYLDKQNLEAKKIDEENKNNALELKKELELKEFIFKVKSKDGNVFNSVSSKQIAEELKNQGYNIDKRKILDFEPLTSLGYNLVKIELYKDVIAEIKVKLIEELP